MRLVWSRLADRQVDEVLASIADDDVATAARGLDQLLERVADLRRFPDTGRIVPEIGRDDLRELLIGSYRVVYRRSSDAVEIVTLRHQARRFDEDGLAR